MMSTLAAFVKKKREALGLNQTELAERCDLPRTTVNRIESGTTKLPEADFRRRLAKGLGVSHIDILIAAGELAKDEVAEAGVEGVVEEGPQQRILNAVKQYAWEDATADIAISHIHQTGLLGRYIRQNPDDKDAIHFMRFTGGNFSTVDFDE